MADPLYELLRPHIPTTSPTATNTPTSNPEISRYLSRLVSLRLNDLTTTEPQSLAQSAQSNLVSIQALSSRSHRTTTTSSDQLSTLRTSLPTLTTSVDALKSAIPDLDSSAVKFASSYNRAKDETAGGNNALLLTRRRESALLARQADKAQDILELPSLLSAAIASASSNANATSTSGAGGANYTQALDLFAHIKRLQILYPESELVRRVVADAQVAMKDMTSNLIASLRTQNIRLAAAIRMIGWLRRVAPELNTSTPQKTSPSSSRAPGGTTKFGGSSVSSSTHQPRSINTTTSQDEGHFGALFLCARLATFLSMTEALAPLRELADQETQARKLANTSTTAPTMTGTAASRPDPTRKSSSSGGGGSYNPLAGQQTERYLKRYIEIFREQSFATISMYRNVFPDDEVGGGGGGGGGDGDDENTKSADKDLLSSSLSLSLPPALQSFPLHLVEIFMSTLKEYLPNITDPAVRESLLMQVLYAANSLGRLGADFSLMIAILYEDEDEDEEEVENKEEEDIQASPVTEKEDEKEEETSQLSQNGETEEDTQEDDENQNQTETKEESPASSSVPPPRQVPEPEWISVIKKHRVQAARLEALAAGQDRVVVQRRESSDVAVR